jgi:signal transduction histidine kinase
MIKKQSFRRKLFLYFFFIFAVFTLVILAFQYNREKEFRVEQLETTLNNITELTHQFIKRQGLLESNNFRKIDSIKVLVPSAERITVINPKGKVLYDSYVSDYDNMENHINRQELREAISSDFGASIRKSATTGISYYYYARFYSNYYVRTAIVYNVDVKNFLETEKLFLFFIAAIFIVLWIVLLAITKKLGETITKLKDFVVKLYSEKETHDNISFPNDEFGIISRQIVNIYKDLKMTKDQLQIEKDKIFGHLHALDEGVAFFSSKKKKILTNNHFIQYVNILSEAATISSEKIFKIEELKSITRFIQEQLDSNEEIRPENLPKHEINIQKGSKYFNVLCIVFVDRSFEIMISDITRLEKRRLMKQQMTSNIAHELKTPVASVMGYIETLMRNNITEDKKRYFIKKAFAQAQRLDELISDISVLNKIEESKEHFIFEKLNLLEVVNNVADNLYHQLEEKKIKLSVSINPEITINGNRSLLFSVFLNLMDNAIKYAGDNIDLTISNYLEDKNYAYLSFRDNGTGIKEEHLPRVFERFYRVDSGRSRKTGGTGLGLAIVKNAIQLHMGEISVRNHPDGGLEFLFTIAK